MNDILVMGSNTLVFTQLLDSLASMFPIKDMGFPDYFLGVELKRVRGGLFLSQQKYIIELHIKSKMDGVKPKATPMSSTEILRRNHSDSISNPTLYRQLVGSLQYLFLTRLDVSFCVSKLSQMMLNPSNSHWAALKRVLRYLKRTIAHGLFLSDQCYMSLKVFSDADWASCPDDRRSTTGYVVYFGRNPLSWSSKKQQTVARTSTESEF